MSGGSFWQMIMGFLAPATAGVQGISPFGPLITACILGLLAYVLIKGQRRYELLHMETEALVRRYMIFRGKRYGTLGKVQAHKGTNKKVLKSISRSWYNFKDQYVAQRKLLERNYQWMQRGFIAGCILLVLNTLWEGMTALLITEHPSNLFSGFFQTLPSYLLVVVGVVLMRSQREEVYGIPAQSMDPTLEAIFADFDREDSRLSEEFDPMEGEEEED
jgi:hypothetical protein